MFNKNFIFTILVVSTLATGIFAQSEKQSFPRTEQLGTSATHNDFDGDGRTDLNIYRDAGANVEIWLLKSADGGNSAFGFGTANDFPLTGDFTGDGKTDYAFYRFNTNEFFVLRSEGDGYFSFPFGQEDDLPLNGDFDGDGIDDPGVFRPSNGVFYILQSNEGLKIEQFGSSSDIPIIADYDGDGRDDIAVYKPGPGEWWINRSQDGLIAFQFGPVFGEALIGGGVQFKPMPADYDGDGKADIAFFNDGVWNVLKSDGSGYFAFPFGGNSDHPVLGDFDGDGINDPAVYRTTNTTWYILGSQDGVIMNEFGTQNDLPLDFFSFPTF